MLNSLIGRLRPKPSVQAVQVSDDHVTLLKGDRPYAQIAWNEIQEVVTFKVDCLTYDDIRLALRVDDGWVEISEDAEGWSALSSALGRHLPTIPTDWYETVMLPPFAKCYRVLYKRAETSNSADPARREADTGPFKRNV
jgi:hypothetical protein